jgi:antitoxin MazE9
MSVDDPLGGGIAGSKSGSIEGMKISVSLPPADVEFLDDYTRARAGQSRSAAIHDAIALLRRDALEDEYAQAWAEWNASGENQVWETATADGVNDASR